MQRIKVKVKQSRYRPEQAQRADTGIPVSFREGVCGQHHAPAALPPGKTRYPLYRRLGGPQGRSERVRKISLPPEFDPRTVHPVASRYTDWAIPAQMHRVAAGKIRFVDRLERTAICRENDCGLNNPQGWETVALQFTFF
jgi:hypothetical protein